VTLLRNFLTFKMASLIDAHLFLLAMVWLVLLVAGVWSILSRPISIVSKFAWIVFIFCLPVIGLTVYVFNCLLNADWELLKQMGLFSGEKKNLKSDVQSSKI
jgi:energy-coupling factor transporter transmembrane protein EcfT